MSRYPVVTRPVEFVPKPVPFARFLGAPDQFVVAEFVRFSLGWDCMFANGDGRRHRTFADAFAHVTSTERNERLVQESGETVAVIVRNAAGECELRTETDLWFIRGWTRELRRDVLTKPWSELSQYRPTPPPCFTNPTPTDRLLTDIATAPADKARALGAGVVDAVPLDSGSKAAEVNASATEPDISPDAAVARLIKLSKQSTIRFVDEWSVPSNTAPRKRSWTVSMSIDGHTFGLDGPRLDSLVAMAEAWSYSVRPAQVDAGGPVGGA